MNTEPKAGFSIFPTGFSYYADTPLWAVLIKIIKRIDWGEHLQDETERAALQHWLNGVEGAAIASFHQLWSTPESMRHIQDLINEYLPTVPIATSGDGGQHRQE